MKRFKKFMAWVLVLAMAVTLVPVRAVKAEEGETEEDISITIEDSEEILNAGATVNGVPFDEGQVEISAKYGEDITLSIQGLVQDGGYYLLHNGDEVIEGKEKQGVANTMDFTVKAVTSNLTLRIGGAYKVQMPQDMLVIPCDIDGNPTNGAEGVNSCLVPSEQSMFYFKVKNGGKYSFTCDGLDEDERLGIANNELDNLVYFLEQYSTHLFNVTAKNLCKLEYQTCIDDEIHVNYGEEIISLWSGNQEERYVPENTTFHFTVGYTEEDYGDDYEYSGAYNADLMVVTLGINILETPEPDIYGENTPSRTYTYTYEIKGGIDGDCVIDVDGIYREATLIIRSYIPKENLIIKDGQEEEQETNIYNDEATGCSILLGQNYTLEVADDYMNTVRVVKDRNGEQLRAANYGTKKVWDITGTDGIFVARENEYDITARIICSDYLEGYEENEVMLYNPSSAAQKGLSGLHMPDSNGKVSFWIKQGSRYDYSNPVIRIENYYIEDKLDVTISRSYEPVVVDSKGTKAYVYTVPLNKDMNIWVYDGTEEETPEGNKIVVQDPPKKDEDNNNNTNNNNNNNNNSNNNNNTPDGATPEPAPAATGTKLTDTAAKCDVKVISDDKADPQVAFVGASDKKATKVTVPDKVTVEGVTYQVTSIADNAFSGNKKLKSVTIGSNVTSIGKNAFKNCTKLKTVDVKSKNITKIDASAFSGSKNLTKIVIKSTKIKSIGKNALKGTNKKLVIKVPKSKLKEYKKLFKNKGNKNVKVTK